MSRAIEIRMTERGFEVTTGGRTTSFKLFDDAVGFARGHYARVQEIRELSARIE